LFSANLAIFQLYYGKNKLILKCTADFLKFVRPSGQKITRTSNTAKYGDPGVRQNFLFVYFVLHWKSEMQRNWYAGTITVNSELDSASNDIYFLILGSIAGPCDFLPVRSDEFQKV
jgi:hypothetical protein